LIATVSVFPVAVEDGNPLTEIEAGALVTADTAVEKLEVPAEPYADTRYQYFVFIARLVSA
jgi:hypothetical protein